jgi:hypothetical protein
MVASTWLSSTQAPTSLSAFPPMMRCSAALASVLLRRECELFDLLLADFVENCVWVRVAVCSQSDLALQSTPCENQSEPHVFQQVP